MKDLDALVRAFQGIGVPFLLSASKESTNVLVGGAHFTFGPSGEFISASAAGVTVNKTTPVPWPEEEERKKPKVKEEK